MCVKLVVLMVEDIDCTIYHTIFMHNVLLLLLEKDKEADDGSII